MNKTWGIYVRYGRITMIKRVGSILQAMKRYNQLSKRKFKSDIWFALIPIYKE